MAPKERGWAIYKGKLRYLQVVFSSETEAYYELQDLLRPYPPDSLWRKKLTVGVYPPPPNSTLHFDPPYGYHQSSRHSYGAQWVPYFYEQQVLSVLRANIDAPIETIIDELHAKRLRTRERARFTPEYTTKILKDLLTEQLQETQDADVE